VLILASYLIMLAEKGLALSHRSDLPPEAIFGEGKPIWYNDPGPCKGAGRGGVIVVALSYMWQTADHPDPDGEQLRDVAEFLRWLQSTDDYKQCTIAVFWDWASLYQDKPRGSRTVAQTVSFKFGLGNVNLWYCHDLTISLLNKKKPNGRRFGYDESGWTTFERAVSEFRKKKTMVLILHVVLNFLAGGTRLMGNGRPLEKTDFARAAKECAKDALRNLATSPDFMDAVLAGKSFTNKADIGFVQRKFRQVFESVVAQSKVLDFRHMEWIATEEWKAFCLHLVPACTRLEKLLLPGNPTLAVDVVGLVAKLPPTLQWLDLTGSACFGDGTKADWARLPELRTVQLGDFEKNTDITGGAPCGGLCGWFYWTRRRLVI
jgi:hypothetical protein